MQTYTCEIALAHMTHSLMDIVAASGKDRTSVLVAECATLQGFMRMRGPAKSKDMMAVRALIYRCGSEHLHIAPVPDSSFFDIRMTM